MVKELEIPSGYNPDDYIVKRINCNGHDGRKIPLTITHNKKTMELTKQLIGVTMSEPGVSRLVSVDLDEAIELSETKELS